MPKPSLMPSVCAFIHHLLYGYATRRRGSRLPCLPSRRK